MYIRSTFLKPGDKRNPSLLSSCEILVPLRVISSLLFSLFFPLFPHFPLFVRFVFQQILHLAAKDSRRRLPHCTIVNTPLDSLPSSIHFITITATRNTFLRTIVLHILGTIPSIVSIATAIGAYHMKPLIFHLIPVTT